MDLNYKQLSESAKIFTKFLNDKGVKASVKSSRYVKDIKAVEVASSIPISDLLKTVGVSGKIQDLPPDEEKKISGKYKAKLINTGKDSFFLVNTFTEKGIENCIRTPELEENTAIHQIWKHFDPVIFRRRRTYKIDL
jgi:hypothetical protein